MIVNDYNSYNITTVIQCKDLPLDVYNEKAKDGIKKEGIIMMCLELKVVIYVELDHK